MCCRYWADESPEIREIVEEMNRSSLVEKWEKTTEITTRGEVRPTNVTPVIASSRSGRKAVFPMRWGFSGRTLLLNARVETAPVKETFKEAWAAHRCIVPASGYFEWERVAGKKRAGDKYMIRPKGSRMTWLCGLYRIEDGLPAFVILTRVPGEGIRFIHDRMPLILPDDCVDEWIRPGAKPERLVDAALTDMTFEKVGPEPDGADENVQLSML